MKKRWVFNKLDFHLGFMKITMEMIMEKLVSENNHRINCFYSCDPGELGIARGLGCLVPYSIRCAKLPERDKKCPIKVDPT